MPAGLISVVQSRSLTFSTCTFNNSFVPSIIHLLLSCLILGLQKGQTIQYNKSKQQDPQTVNISEKIQTREKDIHVPQRCYSSLSNLAPNFLEAKRERKPQRYTISTIQQKVHKDTNQCFHGCAGSLSLVSKRHI